MPLLVKQSGSWRNARPAVKVNGAWKAPVNVYIKQSGTWKPVWTYSWQTGGWSSCSASCGGGTQSRSVTCLRSDGITAPDAYCPGSRPASSQSCNTHSCYTYSWYAGGWPSTCSAYCGSGTQSRRVYCRRSDGREVGDGYCSGSKPAASRNCTSICAWTASSFGACSATCGIGQRTRTVACRSNRTGVSALIADSYCNTHVGPKPATAEYCESCNGCSFEEDSALYAKLNQLNVTEPGHGYNRNTLRAKILSVFSSVQAWWNAYGKSESVCPYIDVRCCQKAGYLYY